MKGNVIVGLDIGTTTIQAVVAQKSKTQVQPQIIGWSVVETRGLRKGVVVDIEEAASSIREVFDKALSHAGVKADEAFVSIGVGQMVVRPSRGVVIVSRADKEITRDDISRALSAAQAMPLNPNREIVHILPRQFSVDNEEGIKDPLGMSGVRLEVDALIIDFPMIALRNLRKAVSLSGIKLRELVASPLASARAILTQRQKELGTLVMDIGGSTSGLAVFEDGDILYAQILPWGSAHVTHDLALGLRTDVDIAELVKRNHGSALVETVSRKDIVDLSKLGGEFSVPRREISEICEARLSEIFDTVQKELKRINRAGMLPGGVVLTGGGAKIPRLVKLAKKILGLPSGLGVVQNITGPEELISDPLWASAFGLVLWGFDEVVSDRQVSDGPWSDFVNWLQNFIP